MSRCYLLLTKLASSGRRQRSWIKDGRVVAERDFVGHDGDVECADGFAGGIAATDADAADAGDAGDDDDDAAAVADAAGAVLAVSFRSYCYPHCYNYSTMNRLRMVAIATYRMSGYRHVDDGSAVVDGDDCGGVVVVVACYYACCSANDDYVAGCQRAMLAHRMCHNSNCWALKHLHAKMPAYRRRNCAMIELRCRHH